MIEPFVKEMMYQLAYMEHQINFYVDCDGSLGTEIINDSSLYEDGNRCGKLLGKIAKISAEHAKAVKEAMAKAGNEDDEE